MTECPTCGSQIQYDRQPHECHPVELRYEASRAYHDDQRRQRYEEFRLGQFVDLGMSHIENGMDVRQAMERAVDAACLHGRTSAIAQAMRTL